MTDVDLLMYLAREASIKLNLLFSRKASDRFRRSVLLWESLRCWDKQLAAMQYKHHSTANCRVVTEVREENGSARNQRLESSSKPLEDGDVNEVVPGDLISDLDEDSSRDRVG